MPLTITLMTNLATENIQIDHAGETMNLRIYKYDHNKIRASFDAPKSFSINRDSYKNKTDNKKDIKDGGY